jgi:hypothetical protein
MKKNYEAPRLEKRELLSAVTADKKKISERTVEEDK